VVDGWGDRLENILRYALLGLLALPDATLQDVADILRRGADEKDGERLRQRAMELATNENVRKFWRKDFGNYQKGDLNPPQNKLSKMLASGTCALMLSQPQSLIDLRAVMEEGRILLADLSGLGSELRDILGSFVIALLHQAALGRAGTPVNRRKDAQVYCDEAHRFAGDRLTDLLDEARKFGLGLTLAHQHLFPVHSQPARGARQRRRHDYL